MKDMWYRLFGGRFRAKSKGKAKESNITENDLISRGEGNGRTNTPPPRRREGYGGLVSGPDDPLEFVRAREQLQRQIDCVRAPRGGIQREISLDSASYPPNFRMVTSEEIAGVVDHVFDVRIQRNAETGALDLPLGCETIGRENVSVFIAGEVRTLREELEAGDVIVAIEEHLLLGHTMDDVQRLLHRRSNHFALTIMKGKAVPGYSARLKTLLHHFGPQTEENASDNRTHDVNEIDGDDGDDDQLPGEPPSLAGLRGEWGSHDVTTGVIEVPAADEVREPPGLSDCDVALLRQIPTRDLRPHHRVKLCDYVDEGNGDWEYIAGVCDLTQQEVRLIKNRTTSGKWTEAMLDQLDKKATATIGDIYDAVKERKRQDIIGDVFKGVILRDLKKMASPRSRPSAPPQQSQPSSFVIAAPPPPVNESLECEFHVQSPYRGPTNGPRSRSTGACEVCGSIHSQYVYISYARDAMREVQVLGHWLTQNGYGAHFDQVDPNGIARLGFPQWKMQQIQEAKFVIVLCTPAYTRQELSPELDGCMGSHEPGCGVSFDMRNISTEVFQKDYARFAPVLMNDGATSFIPMVLRGTLSYRFPLQGEDLLRRIGGISKYSLPPVNLKCKPLLPKREW
ncbi:uncharacterized protein [Oscarella lobularis]|uniref:uncharacterized protein isoform X2 n=1 Tax=Oscarella lobularis TaxID=121494 RepID=UPI00331370FD